MLLKLVILNFNNEQIFATINDKQPKKTPLCKGVLFS